MIKLIFKLSSIQIGLLLFFMPFFVGILEGLISLISFFLNFDFNFPLFESALLIMHFLFLMWIWCIAVTINEKKIKIKNTLFKVCFLFYSTHRLLDFLLNLNLDIFKEGWFLDNKTIILIELLVLLYGVLVFASYIYIAVFTGKIISKIPINNSRFKFINDFPNFLLILVFPLGIPILHSKIQLFLKENELFYFTKSKNKYPVNFSKKPSKKNKNNVIANKEKIDKEDHTRFMPK
ncbi:membrane hypothetical protein [Tenacibaculum litoreum]|uniref:hypothetical protein n=1 Tax=Tenacibaculum litoreum TaxID=321269 RepID=UPI003894DB89